MDHLFHLATIVSIGGETEQMMRVNIDGPRNVAAAARGAGTRHVHPSSLFAFDLREPTLIDEQRPRSGAAHAALHTLELTTKVRRAKAESELGYRPRPIEETVRDIAARFRAQGHGLRLASRSWPTYPGI